MERESDCVIAIRRSLYDVEAFLLDPDDITLIDLKDLSELRLRRALLQQGEKDIDEALLTTCANGETIAVLKAYATENAQVRQAELRDRLRELATAGLLPSNRNELERSDTE